LNFITLASLIAVGATPVALRNAVANALELMKPTVKATLLLARRAIPVTGRRRSAAVRGESPVGGKRVNLHDAL